MYLFSGGACGFLLVFPRRQVLNGAKRQWVCLWLLNYLAAVLKQWKQRPCVIFCG